MKKAILLATFFVSGMTVFAQNVSIIEDLSQKDEASGATVVVHQSQSIDYLLNKTNTDFSSANTLKKGWSVQVFSENSQSAKDEAFAVENKILKKLPYENVRVERFSPFWKVRVGKFQTSSEAQELKELLLKEFPELKGNIYIVKFNE
ncbi:MAG: SPOR domain-containing protein [Prevotellaceae bacterium]|jgi:hypothetical protein|nr:SPOR domain-containing protein [Prevotellaceae bacterium]